MSFAFDFNVLSPYGKVNPQQTNDYLARLLQDHVDIEPFVANALGLRLPPGAPRSSLTVSITGPQPAGRVAAAVAAAAAAAAAAGGSGRLSTGGAGGGAARRGNNLEEEEEERGGHVVWVPTRAGQAPGAERGAHASAAAAAAVATGAGGGGSTSTMVVPPESHHWPGLALHLDGDRDLIPPAAIAALRPGQTAASHR